MPKGRRNRKLQVPCVPGNCVLHLIGFGLGLAQSSWFRHGCNMCPCVRTTRPTVLKNYGSVGW